MRAGEMDRVIVIEQLLVVRGSQGGEDKKWIRFARVWASVRELAGSDAFISEQTHAFIRTVFRIHFRPGIKSSMRINYEGDIYDMQGKPKELGRREGLEITAIARVE